MQYLATIMLVMITITLVVCGILLWRRRKETGDYSRTIQALFSWASAFFTLTFIMRTWQETTTVDGAFFEPEHTFVPLLSEVLESNRTYVGEAFKRNTGMTFIEYLTKHRIDYIVARIKDDPKADIHQLFNHVGYRQRSTAWRNFQKITGMTPTEFVNNLK